MGIGTRSVIFILDRLWDGKHETFSCGKVRSCWSWFTIAIIVFCRKVCNLNSSLLLVGIWGSRCAYVSAALWVLRKCQEGRYWELHLIKRECLKVHPVGFWDFFFLAVLGSKQTSIHFVLEMYRSSVFPIVELTTSMRRFRVGVLPKLLGFDMCFAGTVRWTTMRCTTI